MSGKLLLQSAPLALLLFLVLPRFAPLWLVPNMKEAQTGLSDTLSVGDITKLTRSTELAFRASFQGESPRNAHLYWRALVLEDYDGLTWRQEIGIKKLQQDAFLLLPYRPNPAKQFTLAESKLAQDPKTNSATPPQASPNPQPSIYRYQVIAEPSHQPWLFGLDLAYSQDEGIVNLPDYRLYALRNVDQRISYRVESWPSVPMDLQLTNAQRDINLKLPSGSNPRTLALAKQFNTQYPAPKQRLWAMMRYFNSQPYFYTLTPPPLGPQQIDDFLFENKAGFCVHYASALIFMARATGLPARMVTGYQGGEYNPQAGYLSVYQYMAHAWAEIWLEGEGWVRFDPTAMVAPNRIELGFDAQFDPEQSYLQESPFSPLRLKALPWLNELRQRFASIDYYWSLWVLGFNQERQNKVLRNLLGDVTKTKVAVFMSLCIGLIGLYIAYSVGLFRVKQGQDPISERYQGICKRLAKHGIHRSPNQGPNHFAAQILTDYRHKAPKLCSLFSELTESYVALKYQNLPAQVYQQQLVQFKTKAKALHLLLMRPNKHLK